MLWGSVGSAKRELGMNMIKIYCVYVPNVQRINESINGNKFPAKVSVNPYFEIFH